MPGKLLASLLLMRIQYDLLKFERPEQFWLINPVKSTIDLILVLRVLVKFRLKFRHSILTAYVDIKKAFDLVRF